MMDEFPRINSPAVSAPIGRLDAVPTLLAVLRDTTGMRFSAIARVENLASTVYACQDALSSANDNEASCVVQATLAFELPSTRGPIIVEHASVDSQYRSKAPHAIESYISVPIRLTNGSYFGVLCACDPSPMKIKKPTVVSVFTRFAALIASQLENHREKECERRALLDERAAGELREQFIAILGHDLRNPLQAVLASSELLQRKVTDPQLVAYADRIKINAKRMSALIDDVLDFARGRLGGGIAVEITEVQNITAGLTTVVQEFQDAQPDCNILSSINVDRAVSCDLGRLQQVASNLLANALTHGSAGTPVKFTVSADDTHLTLDVWNAGDPIPAASIEQIFQPFWRASVSSSRHGLGLGLHICSQIVGAHGGELSVTSTAAQGTLFTARLPLESATIKDPASIVEAGRSRRAPIQWTPSFQKPGVPICSEN